jgi:hypothetical protein
LEPVQPGRTGNLFDIEYDAVTWGHASCEPPRGQRRFGSPPASSSWSIGFFL